MLRNVRFVREALGKPLVCAGGIGSAEGFAEVMAMGAALTTPQGSGGVNPQERNISADVDSCDRELPEDTAPGIGCGGEARSFNCVSYIDARGTDARYLHSDRRSP